MTKHQLKIIFLLAGIIISLFLFFVNPFSVSKHAAIVLAVGGLMITWWLTEALPMPVVALLPLICFPLLGISSIETAAGPYADPVIFLFLGGFMLGLAIEKWNLHRRIALNIVRLTGTSGDRIVLGFILSTGLLSMWLSNTATTMMMYPIALSVILVMKEKNNGIGNMKNLSLTLMLAIAYASNIGGIATIVGTPPNSAYVGIIRQRFDYDIYFTNWMALCMPLAILLLFCLYLVMVKWLFPSRIRSDISTHEYIRGELNLLGPLSKAEKRVLFIFAGTAFLWMARGIINKMQDWITLDDTIIALMCAVALFICPSGSRDERDDAVLEWSDTSKMAWGILLLFGGGLSLAKAMQSAGLIEQLGQWLAQFAGNKFILVLTVVYVAMFLSEVMSNVAQVIVFTPVVSSLAVAVGMNPLMLGIPMTLAASCAGMLPMGTPPNAIVFASGHIRLNQMAKAGFVMNLVAGILITLFCWFFLPLIMGEGIKV